MLAFLAFQCSTISVIFYFALEMLSAAQLVGVDGHDLSELGRARHESTDDGIKSANSHKLGKREN